LLSHPQVAVVVASCIAMACGASEALGAPMDPTPERLYLQPPNIPMGTNCQSIASNPQAFLTKTGLTPNNFPCLPNNVSWANLMSELGYAIAPSAFHPARTTGFGGFALTLEASFAHINANASDNTGTKYWHLGTQGGIDPSTNQFSSANRNPDSILQIYTLKARKGLGFGFEVAGGLGYVANTSLWVGGGDLHWALLEGYRTGILGYLPDVAIGGGVRTLGGSPKFFLTTVGVDAQVSKPFALADSTTITPYVGAQRLYIFADSAVVSLTPNVDALAQCGYAGTNSTTGLPVCNNKLTTPSGATIDDNSDFNNQTTFTRLRVQRWRAIAGMTYRYELLYLAGQFAADVEEPGGENNWSAGVSGAKQWTVSLEAGVFF
jgi:hypothetical protein